jgi:hypothetical protein
MSILRGHTTHELDSKILAHRNKLLGFWAAARMGMMSEAAVEYAFSLLPTGTNHNDSALVKKVCADMSARGYPITEDDVRRQLAACARDARADCA